MTYTYIDTYMHTRTHILTHTCILTCTHKTYNAKNNSYMICSDPTRNECTKHIHMSIHAY